MKNLFAPILLIVAIGLSGCEKINEQLADLNDRLTQLENSTIPVINDQIGRINTSIDELVVVDEELNGYISVLQAMAKELQESIDAVNVRIGEVQGILQSEISVTKAELLAQLQALETEMQAELSQINNTILVLQTKDVELEENIAALRNYVDNELSNTTDWVAATFTTLEQYEILCADIATIKTQIEVLHTSISDLESRLNNKISADIAAAVEILNADMDAAVEGLNAEIASKVSEITDAYSAAISSAKEEITEAYTTAMETAITDLETSMKQWVNEQLANYYTIAQIDAKLEAISNDFEGKLSSQKIYLESLISSLSNTLLTEIGKNGELILALRNDLSSLEEDVAHNAEAIANNAEKIANNATAIMANTEAIVANAKQIEVNKGLIESNTALLTQKIEANTSLIAENKQLIAEVDAKVDNSSNVANAKAIADNAKAIADNAELIAQNTIAINNNTSAIATNAVEIENLKVLLSSAKEEITQAYTELIEKSINELNGKLDSAIATVNERIDSKVEILNNSIDDLSARVTSIENEILSIKNTILLMQDDIEAMQNQISLLMNRIQSVTYVPKYSDGRATMDYGTKKAEFDFMISPKSAVEELVVLWSSALSMRALYTQTRAVDFVELPIIAFEADNTNGVISLTVSGENLDSNFFVEQQDASAFLQISDGNSHIASDYIAMTPNYNIQFEDPAVKAICCSKWDTNGDAELSYEEAAAVKNIGTAFRENVDIISFSELKHFIGLTYISAEAFSDAINLLKVELPKNIAYLGNSAFSGCKNIKNIDCPMFLDSISASAFSGCVKLETINLQSVKNIGDYAFQSCGKLKHITLSHIESIGKYAFSGCEGLEYLYIGNSVAQWGSPAFSGCTGELVCMSSAMSEAFKYSKFTKATLAGESYGNDLFRPYGQSPSADAYTLEILILEESVKEIRSLGQRPSIVYCKSLKPPYIYNNPFVLSMIIYVPIGCYDAYIQGKDGWSNYSSKIEEYDFDNNPI